MHQETKARSFQKVKQHLSRSHFPWAAGPRGFTLLSSPSIVEAEESLSQASPEASRAPSLPAPTFYLQRSCQQAATSLAFSASFTGSSRVALGTSLPFSVYVYSLSLRCHRSQGHRPVSGSPGEVRGDRGAGTKEGQCRRPGRGVHRHTSRVHGGAF